MTTLRIILAGGFLALCIYLFVSALTPLPQDGQARAGTCFYDTREVFEALNAINDAARGIYTARIVGGGVKAGLKFGEDWEEPDVDKGPLPALFLRLTAARLETKPPEIGLYLGSDAPINASNLFASTQEADFAQLKARRAPVFSETEDGRTLAMYPDIAGVAPCVTCHNEHPDSPKTDWKLGDVMGATTWTYPGQQIAAQDALASVSAMLSATQEAYELYLSKVAEFPEAVPVADIWPSEGQRSLPSGPIFMEAVRQAASPEVTQILVSRVKAIEFNADFEPCSH